MLLSHTFTVLALASTIAAAPADLWKRAQVVLGYRTVCKEEAEKINAAGAPVWDDVDYDGGRQIGKGVYTTPGPGQWEVYPGEWVCVIWCDDGALDRVSKAWVPEYWNDVDLWWQDKNPEHIPDYITTSLDSTWDPTKTLLMAIIDDHEPTVQLLIPPALVAASGAMSLKAQCVENQSDLPVSTIVDYDSWQNNIKGDKNPGSDVIVIDPPPKE